MTKSNTLGKQNKNGHRSMVNGLKLTQRIISFVRKKKKEKKIDFCSIIPYLLACLPADAAKASRLVRDCSQHLQF